MRALDVACRVGSTEFGVIMAETDSRSASVAAERVLRAMARVRSPNGLQPQAAVGIASCPAHADGFDELVERAGSALRSARRAVRREEARAGTVTVSMAVWDDGDETLRRPPALSRPVIPAAVALNPRPSASCPLLSRPAGSPRSGSR